MRSPECDVGVEAIVLASACYNDLFRKTALRNTSEIGMTKKQIEVLITLQMDGPTKMSELCARLDIAREQGTRIVNTLKEQGHVSTVRLSENKKHVVASITDEGEKLLNSHKQESRELLKRFLDGLNQEDRENLIIHSEGAAEILRRNSSSIDGIFNR